MDKITKKGEIRDALTHCFQAYEASDLTAFTLQLHHQLLEKKVKFPLLEYAAIEIFSFLDESLHIPVCDAISHHKTIGGNVILGILLKQRLPEHFEESLAKATEYIVAGKEWYVSDIIGERVLGNAILQFPEKALPALWHLSKHPINWPVRAIGAGSHLATKRGLEKAIARPLFQLLLHLGDHKDYQVRRGIGWAAKTMAKFHPDIIKENEERLQGEEIGSWFKRKVNIGLERHRHAQGN